MKFFPIKGGIEPGTDLNTIGGAGIYNLSGEYANAPFSQSWDYDVANDRHLQINPEGTIAILQSVAAKRYAGTVDITI
jgi:hypothetical protein